MSLAGFRLASKCLQLPEYLRMWHPCAEASAPSASHSVKTVEKCMPGRGICMFRYMWCAGRLRRRLPATAALQGEMGGPLRSHPCRPHSALVEVTARPIQDVPANNADGIARQTTCGFQLLWCMSQTVQLSEVSAALHAAVDGIGFDTGLVSFGSGGWKGRATFAQLRVVRLLLAEIYNLSGREPPQPELSDLNLTPEGSFTVRQCARLKSPPLGAHWSA